MGRDWYWATGAKASFSTSSSSRRASERDSAQTTTPGCISAVFHLFDFHHFQFPLNHQTSSSSSSCFKPDSFLSPDSTNTIKGAEAPRNSLESEEEGSSASAASLTSTSKEEENLNIPMGIQIKTSGDTRSKVGAPDNNDISSEISCSPGTKTPTLVARLMGLDLLPETRSPSSSSVPSFRAKSHLNHNIQPQKPLQSKTTSHRNSLDGEIRGTRSLPETPRISSARRSDVDHHHRLSLQINKENMSVSEELVMSRLSSLKRKELKHEDESRSPGQYYARQIVKQVKESVNRKVGTDITNTVRNREQAKEELVNQFKYKKISRALTKVTDDSSPGKHSTPSCSPRLRFLESKNKPVMNSSTKDHNPQPPKSSFSSSPEISIQPQAIRVLPKPKLQPVEEEQDEHHEQRQPPPSAASKCKNGFGGKFGSRLKKPQQTSDIIRNKQEEPFVRPSTANRVNIPDKKCRKNPLSSDLLNITVPTLLPVKKDPSPPATKIPQKQVSDAQRPKRSSQLSSCSSQTYNKQEATNVHVARDDNNGDRCNDATTTSSSTGDEAAEYEYIARILRRTGLDKDTPVSFTSWFSPSHPLDPSIFYYLEHFTTCSTTLLSNNNKTKSSQLTHRCNRKLLFHLVDEILVEVLKPYFNMKPWVITVGHDDFSQMDGSQLIDTLCSKIRSFPRADCRVLEDIDALIDKDLPEMKLQSGMAYEEEGEGIVTEIEKDILGALVHETALDFGVRV